jgi:2-desacetyl-2-hydroxyethyl bacteriochlorophyllide A dehydrogenase
MLALRLEEPGRFTVVELPEPAEPGPGEALVRTRRVAICGTDIHAFHGRQPFFQYPRILGHELAVEVEAVGAGVARVRPGDRCSVEPYLCQPGDVAWRRGKTHCTATTECLGVHRDGGMRARWLVPADHLHSSAALDWDCLALVETLAIGRHAVGRAAPLDDEKVAVIGLGPIGLSVVQFLLLRGLDVTAVDLAPARVETCQRLYPAAKTLRAEPGGDLAARLRECGGGELPETVFDATGHAGSMEASVGLTAHGGKVVFVGLVRQRLSFDDPEFHRRELSLLASRNATAPDFGAILRQLEAGLVDVRPWFTHRCGAADFPAQFPRWLTPGSGLLKGIVEFPS